MCLRIVDKIDRFSEDLDFILINKKLKTIDLAKMLDDAKDILLGLGLNLEVTQVLSMLKLIFLKSLNYEFKITALLFQESSMLFYAEIYFMDQLRTSKVETTLT